MLSSFAPVHFAPPVHQRPNALRAVDEAGADTLPTSGWWGTTALVGMFMLTAVWYGRRQLRGSAA